MFYDLDRFGRHAQHTMKALYDLAELRITIWDFRTGQQLDLDSFEGETMTFMKARFAQQFRDQIRKHTTAAMRREAEQGYVCGGETFGYTNVRIGKGHVERTINEAEATVVRTIYERFAAGDGARSIAAALNEGRSPRGRCNPVHQCRRRRRRKRSGHHAARPDVCVKKGARQSGIE